MKTGLSRFHPCNHDNIIIPHPRREAAGFAAGDGLGLVSRRYTGENMTEKSGLSRHVFTRAYRRAAAIAALTCLADKPEF